MTLFELRAALAKQVQRIDNTFEEMRVHARFGHKEQLVIAYRTLDDLRADLNRIDIDLIAAGKI